MDRRKGTGVMIFTLSIAGFFTYAYLLMLSEWSPIIQQLTMLMIVGGILGVVAWIGYVTATTRPSSATIISDDGGHRYGHDNDNDNDDNNTVATDISNSKVDNPGRINDNDDKSQSK